MISYVTYDQIKRMTEERTRRSLLKYEARRTTAADSFVRPKTDADVIELVFVTGCDAESIGA
jgi:hypothetical protein